MARTRGGAGTMATSLGGQNTLSFLATANAASSPVASTPSSSQLPRWVIHRIRSGAAERIVAAA